MELSYSYDIYKKKKVSYTSKIPQLIAIPLNESLAEEAVYHHIIKNSMITHLHKEEFGCKLGADIFNLDVI